MSHDAHLPGYTIRRPLGVRSLLPAVGVGIAAGLAAFYVTRLFLERQPVLDQDERERRARALERRTGRRVTSLGGAMVGGSDDLEADEPLDDELDAVDARAARLVDELDDDPDGDADRDAWTRARG